ncbi:MAG: inositol monophosphatase family protein [Gemmatimonadaceae bacterium]
MSAAGHIVDYLAEAMRTAALQAARYIESRAADRGALVWEHKAPADFVSDVDRGAEAMIRELLDGRSWMDPDTGWMDPTTGAPLTAAIVAEESSPDLAVAADVVFIVDPLDGTTNFLHGYPWYAVSIAAVLGGELVAGVVHNVPTGDVFTATLGRGAKRNDTAIHVSASADPSRALIGTGFPFKQLVDLELYQRQFAAVTRQTAGIRRAGSAALDLCDVACGRFDAFWELGLSAWDIAAGLLIVREAGGRVTDLEGRPATVRHGAIVAGSAKLHPWLLDTLSEAPDRR